MLDADSASPCIAGENSPLTNFFAAMTAQRLLSQKIETLADDHLGHSDAPASDLLDELAEEMDRPREVERMAASVGERLRDGASAPDEKGVREAVA